MDWTQTLTLGGTLILYITVMCVFFYHLNDKAIKEWRDEHASQIKESEAHWREMFTYMNGRIDTVKKD